MQWSHWFAGLINTSPSDRMFNCLPLYHSVGGVVATGATLVSGGAVVIRPRFSASDFWRDVREERCTLFQYIGELCRYLRECAAADIETAHELRMACGNGLRPDVWELFQERFQIPRILEYYASTEGNFSLYNCEGRCRAPSGRFRRFWRIACRSRCCDSMSKRRAAAQRGGFVRALRGQRSGRGGGIDSGRGQRIGGPIRGLCGRRGFRAQSSARCVRRMAMPGIARGI